MRKFARPHSLLSLLFITCSILMFQNCAQHEFASVSSIETGLGDGGEAAVEIPPNVICDPFGNSTQTKAGLAAELYYYDKADASSQINYLADIFSKGTKLQNTIVLFSSIYVPTRNWTNGFDVNGASKVKDSNGNSLIEWFGLDMKTNIKLQSSDAEGLYQFATISDDGSIVAIDSGSGYQTIVNNDGLNSTRLLCGGVVQLSKNAKYPARIQYFQGPREEIALTMLWRKVSAGTNLQSAGCGDYGGFWNNGQQTAKFGQLVQDGWQVIPAGNFETQVSVPNVCE